MSYKPQTQRGYGGGKNPNRASKAGRSDGTDVSRQTTDTSQRSTNYPSYKDSNKTQRNRTEVNAQNERGFVHNEVGKKFPTRNVSAPKLKKS